LRLQVAIIASITAARSFGAAPRAGECPISAPGSDAAQGSLRSAIAEEDPAVVKETDEVGPTLEHVVDRFQSLCGARKRLAREPSMHVVEGPLALLLAHGAPFFGTATIDSLFDFDQRVEHKAASRAIREIGLPFSPSRPSFSISASSEKPHRTGADQKAG